MGETVLASMLLVLASVQPADLSGEGVSQPGQAEAAEGSEPEPLVPYPHPLITGVLYAVPTSGGDANGDGRRHATGDEFIEVTNPHDRSIALSGYRLVDRHMGERGRFAFVFPDFMLEPGQTAIVFNGFEAEWTGPVGDTHRAPPGANPAFEGAFVFTAEAANRYMALANAADFVLLENPLGVPVQVVVWGNPDQRPPTEVYHTDTIVSDTRGSVQRMGPAEAMRPHDRIDRQTCSPGVAFPKPPVPRVAPSDTP